MSKGRQINVIEIIWWRGRNPLLPLTMTASLGTWNTGVYCLFIGIRNGQPGSNQLGTEYRWTEMCFIASWKQFMTTSRHRSSHLTTSPMQEGIVSDIFISLLRLILAMNHKRAVKKGRSSPWLWIQLYSRLKLIILVSPVLWYEILLWNLKFTFNISLSYGRPMSIANNIIYSQMEKKSISFCNLLLVFLPLTHL